MSMRKTRNHALGQCTSDTRTATETKIERKDRPPLHESTYPYHESQLNLPRIKTVPFLMPDPVLAQTQYYQKSNKQLHFRQTLSRSKSTEEDLYKPSLDKNLKTSSSKLQTIEEHKEKVIDKYHVSKEVEHKKASAETQLVHIEKHSTLEGKVDLRKVADIRRTIRRRYANRNDFRKIFNQWDKNSAGVLMAQDIHEMVNKLGIPINLHEARVLVASANLSNTGSLNLNEFMGLIFDQDDRMNVDLSTLSDTDEDKLKIIDQHSLAVNRHKEAVQGQLKTFLKDNFYGLAPQFTRKDKNKTGKVSLEDFIVILDSMNVPISLSSDKIWKSLYNDNSDKSGLDYKLFLNNLEKFESVQVPQEDFKPPPQIPEKKSESPPVPKTDPLMSLNILNRQKVPVNQLDNFFLRARKIRLFLRENMKSESDLVSELQGKTGKEVISLDELKDYVIFKLEEKKTMKITKKELEGFLSSYIYNKDGVTSVSEVAKNIFMEDTKALFELHQVKRSIPPIRSGLEFSENDSSSVKRILTKIEDKFFNNGSQKANEIFKKFDRDRDGFITEEDLAKALEVNQIVHEPHEVKSLMAFLDTNQNGYVSFKEFNQKIRPNILAENRDRLKEDSDKFSLTHQPSLDYLKTQQSKLGYFGKLQEDLVSEFRPDDKIIHLVPKTRYGANPAHQNTFVNFEVSGGEDGRVSKRFEPINIGKEEKDRKLQGDLARIDLMKKDREERSRRLKVIEDNVMAKDVMKITMRAASKDNYEMRCKLSSPFANTTIE